MIEVTAGVFEDWLFLDFLKINLKKRNLEHYQMLLLSYADFFKINF